jgi:hypothetical protein
MSELLQTNRHDQDDRMMVTSPPIGCLEPHENVWSMTGHHHHHFHYHHHHHAADAAAAPARSLQFVDWYPGVDQGTLETFVPYALIHHAHMELSLDRQKDAGDSALIPLVKTKVGGLSQGMTEGRGWRGCCWFVICGMMISKILRRVTLFIGAADDDDGDDDGVRAEDGDDDNDGCLCLCRTNPRRPSTLTRTPTSHSPPGTSQLARREDHPPTTDALESTKLLVAIPEQDSYLVVGGLRIEYSRPF